MNKQQTDGAKKMAEELLAKMEQLILDYKNLIETVDHNDTVMKNHAPYQLHELVHKKYGKPMHAALGGVLLNMSFCLYFQGHVDEDEMLSLRSDLVPMAQQVHDLTVPVKHDKAQ